MPLLVHHLVQQQCHWKNGAQRVPIPDDRHVGPVVQHNIVQRAVLQFVAYPKVPGDSALLLHASDRPAGLWQAIGLRDVAHIAVESARFLRAHW